MRIALAHYRYYQWGGPERYLFGIKEALEAAGHQVVPFSLEHEDNEDTPYATYFTSAIGSSRTKRFGDEPLTPALVWRKLERLFYSPVVERQFGRLLDDVQPDVVYLLQFLRHMSPAVLVAAKQRSLPVVVRLSDYEIVCPQAHLIRNGRICEECVERRSFWPSVQHGCVQGSKAQSLVNALAAGYHQLRGYTDLIDMFVTPSHTVREKMIAAGFDENRLTTIPTFVNSQYFMAGTVPPSQRRTMVYVGQLRPEKGVDVLIRAWLKVANDAAAGSVKLVVTGSGPLAQRLRDLAGGDPTIEFAGAVSSDDVRALLQNARASIMPSICYENLPNAVLESYATATPVIASNLGSMAEVVADGLTGWTFAAGSDVALAACLKRALVDDVTLDEMSRHAVNRAAAEYATPLHLSRLLTLFERLTPVRVAAPEIVPSWI
jgi:glycosyltransferase involved in cell wall biosynthesis